MNMLLNRKRATQILSLILLLFVEIEGKAADYTAHKEHGKDIHVIATFSEKHRKTKTVLIIRAILAQTGEYHSHNLNGATGNTVVLHEDGHREAVYDQKGQLVIDCANAGSYNFFHPMKQPLRHFTADILPWLRWGNCKDDPTTQDERIHSYVKDFGDGLRKVLENRKELQLDQSLPIEDESQTQALAFFEAAIHVAHDDSVFDFFEQGTQPIPDVRIEIFLENLAVGIKICLE
jgi:hypothetical protein